MSKPEEPSRRRLHIQSIEEENRGGADLDPELGELFREMRQASGLSMEELAVRLNTGPQVLGALERGEIAALPSWSETSRVVSQYTGMLGLDAGPVLRRIMVHLPGEVADRPRTRSHVPSVDVMRSNVGAAMHHIPASVSGVENPQIPAASPPGAMPGPGGQTGGGAGGAPGVSGAPGVPGALGGGGSGAGFPPGYADMRAVTPGLAGAYGKSRPAALEPRRKSGIFTLFMQLLLLLAILAGGWLAWLAVNDPQGFEAFKAAALAKFEMFRAQVDIWLGRPS